MSISPIPSISVRRIRHTNILSEMMSMPGDSGAPVIDENGKWVGIVVAGDEKDRTLILPVMYLFTQLGYKLFKQ